MQLSPQTSTGMEVSICWSWRQNKAKQILDSSCYPPHWPWDRSNVMSDPENGNKDGPWNTDNF
jgi:hypothetical protein